MRLPQSWRDWPLASRLILLTLVLALVPLFVVTAYSQTNSRAELLKATRAQNLQRARGTARYIGIYLQGLVANLRVLSADAASRRLLEGSASDADLAEAAAEYRRVVAAHSYEAVYLTDHAGAVLVATDERLVGRTYMTARWFLNAIAGQSGFDQPRYDPEDAQVYLHASVPVQSATGSILGTLVARISMAQVDQWIAADTSFAGRGEYGVLWDELGVRISHGTRPDLRFKPIMPLSLDVEVEMAAAERYGPDTASLLRDAAEIPELLDATRAVLFDSQYVADVRFRGADGTVMLAAPAPVPSQRWVYAVFVSEPTVLAGVDRQLRNALIVAALAGLLAAAAAVFGASLVTRPLRRVAEVASAIAAGDHERRVRLSSRDEVGRLGSAFDAMTDALTDKEKQLRLYAQNLEQTIQERTATLRASEAELRAIFSAMRDAIIILNSKGDCLKIAPTNPRSSFRLPASMAGKTIEEMTRAIAARPNSMPRLDVGWWLDHIHRALEAQKPVTVEFALPLPDGEAWALATLSPMTEDTVLCVVRDVTSARRSAEALRQSEAKFRSLFETASDAITISAWDGRYLEVNQVACARLDYTHEEMLGMNRLDILSPARQATLQEHLDELRRRRTAVRETEHLRKDGSAIAVELNERVIDYGGQEAILTIARDITERRRLEDQLRQAQKMETVGRLAGGVAHDFNNLLTAIIGNATFAAQALAAGDPVRHDIEQVLKASTRAANLTRQLLAFSRRQVLEMRPLNMNELIGDMEKMLRRLIGEDIDLITCPAGDLGIARADRGQIEQVLVNLVVNARDSMPGSGRLIIETANALVDESHARAHADATPGEFILLAVTDTGQGMTEEVKAHLFEPFFTTKAVGKGTGLGLATVYGIVRQHGGHINVYSELGIGTTFKIFLPRVRDEMLDGEPAEATVHRPIGGSETILLVEDEETVRCMAARALRDLGYPVLEAANGEEGRRVADAFAGSIDLLVSDVVMPVMGGEELARQLVQKRPSLKVLFISGYTEHHLQSMDSAGGHPLLQKPFAAATLGQKVREVLDFT